MKSFPPVLVLLSLLVFAASSLRAAGIEYPLGGNFETEEGTIEMWLTPTVEDLYPPDDGNYHQLLSFFRIEIPGEWSMSVSWYRYGGQLGIKSSMDSLKVPSGILAILPEPELPDWKAGRMQRLAFVWKGRDMKLYADGRMIGQREQVIPFGGLVAGQKILFGGKDGGTENMILHAVRISSIARTPAELAVSEPVEDKYTLLLDRFDNSSIADSRKTTPLVIHDRDTGGTINGGTQFMTEPAPGLLLHP